MSVRKRVELAEAALSAKERKRAERTRQRVELAEAALAARELLAREEIARELAKPLTRHEQTCADRLYSPGDRSRGMAAVKASWDAAGISHLILESESTIALHRIVVPKEIRGGGVGTSAMQQLIAYADRAGKDIELSPSSAFGGTVSRLESFYRSFGFVTNEERDKDFTTLRGSLVRRTQGEQPASAADIAAASALLASF